MDQAEEIQQLKNKIADLEDRSMRNNIKFRGSLNRSPIVIWYLTFSSSFMKLLPDHNLQDFIIDRLHRIFKLKHLPASVPRDVLASIHLFHIKAHIMLSASFMKSHPEPYTQLSLFTDVLVYTAQRRRDVAPITKTLGGEISCHFHGGFQPSSWLLTKVNQSMFPPRRIALIVWLDNWGMVPKAPLPNPGNNTLPRILSTLDTICWAWLVLF